MFKHLLIATDGSAIAARAARAGVGLAKANAARVSAVYVARPFHPLAWEVEALVDTRAEYERYHELRARRALGQCRSLANRAGVRFQELQTGAKHPYLGILRAARERGCDLIVMGSHGRRGVRRLALGSEAEQVIKRSRVPVLVYR